MIAMASFLQEEFDQRELIGAEDCKSELKRDKKNTFRKYLTSNGFSVSA
jgi:hypothetical protein